MRGIETEEDMGLEVHGLTPMDTFYFHSAIALTADRRTLYACIAISDYAVARYRCHTLLLLLLMLFLLLLHLITYLNPSVTSDQVTSL